MSKNGAKPVNSPRFDPVFVKSPFFLNMNEAEFEKIAVFFERRSIKKGEAVFSEGDFGDEIYILVSGKLYSLVKQSDGTTRRLFEIKLGAFFGEMSVIAKEPRSATIVAEEDAGLMVLQGIDFYRIVYELPEIGSKLFKAIAQIQTIWFDQSDKHVQDLERWGEDASRRAITDDLTGLFNRRFLERNLQGRFSQGSIGLRKTSLLIIDLDFIHGINDKYGPSAGDAVIKAVAEVLKKMMRSGDISARLSGDEFAVLLPDTDVDEARVIGNRIREEANAGDVEGVPVRISLSIGLAVAPAHGNSRETLFNAADAALRRAKERGRNRVETA